MVVRGEEMMVVGGGASMQLAGFPFLSLGSGARRPSDHARQQHAKAARLPLSMCLCVIELPQALRSCVLAR